MNDDNSSIIVLPSLRIIICTFENVFYIQNIPSDIFFYEYMRAVLNIE